MRSGQDLPDVEIRLSFWRVLGLFVVSVAFALAGASVVFGWYPYGAPDTKLLVVSYAGMILFGLAACVIARKLWPFDGPVLFINRDGIRDTRVSTYAVPWQSVEAISIWQVHREKFVVLKVSPAVMRQLAGTPVARAVAALNRMLGMDGIHISIGPLKVDAEELLKICMTYHAAARARKTRPVVFPSA